MSGPVKIYLIASILALLLILAIGPLRALVGGLFSMILTPAFILTVKTVATWIWAFVKGIFRSHTMLLKHLIKPHKVIYPTLKNDDDRRL